MKAVLLYVTIEAGKVKKPDLLTVFKVLYFADRKHLVKYGRPIIEDNYIAMKNGPVPSLIYDWVKAVRGDGYKSKEFTDIYSCFSIDKDRKVIIPHDSPNMLEISKSEIKCIEESIKENAHLDFNNLSQKSHGPAYDAADFNDKIDRIEIAKEGGANPELLKYIESQLEANSLDF